MLMPHSSDRKPLHRVRRVLHGGSLLAFDAVHATTGIVEAMHATIAARAFPLGRGRERTGGITRLVYGSIRGINGLLRRGVEFSLGQLGGDAHLLPGDPREDAAMAALNGVLGDYLERSGNPLALPMRLRRGISDGSKLRTPSTRLPGVARQAATSAAISSVLC